MQLELSEEEREAVLVALREWVPRDEYGLPVRQATITLMQIRMKATVRELHDKIRTKT